MNDLPRGESGWAKAARFVLPFGKYRGQSVDAIAQSDEGLLYLDWLRGEVDAGKFRLSNPETQDALRVALRDYLDDHTIADDLRRTIAQNRRG